MAKRATHRPPPVRRGSKAERDADREERRLRVMHFCQRRQWDEYCVDDIAQAVGISTMQVGQDLAVLGFTKLEQGFWRPPETWPSTWRIRYRLWRKRRREAA